MLRMVDNLLTLTELSAGRLSVQPAPFGLRQLLEQLRARYGAQAAAKGLRFEVLIDGMVPDALVAMPSACSRRWGTCWTTPCALPRRARCCCGSAARTGPGR